MAMRIFHDYFTDFFCEMVTEHKGLYNLATYTSKTMKHKEEFNT